MIDWRSYKPTGELSEAAYSGEAILRPLLTVELRGPRGIADADLLVDSGAEYTIVTMAFARRIGADAELRDDWVEHIRLGGQSHDAHLAHVQLAIGSDEFEAIVGFVEEWKWVGFSGVLGQRGFFDRYGVLFDRINRRFALIQQEVIDSTFPSYEAERADRPRFAP